MGNVAMFCVTTFLVAVLFGCLWALGRACEWADRRWPMTPPQPDEPWGMERLTDREFAKRYPGLASRVSKWSRYR